MGRNALGILLALGALAVFSVAMVPFRSSLSVAMTALVLVVPIIIGVVVGGRWAGIVSVVVGFLVYVYLFVPPYDSPAVGARENWLALAVYVAITLPVAAVVDRMHVARAKERQRNAAIRQLLELSENLIEDRPLDTLLSNVVAGMSTVFDARQIAILLAAPEGLLVAASAGASITGTQYADLAALWADPSRIGDPTSSSSDPLVLPLTAAGRPIGLLVLAAAGQATHDRRSLVLFAHQIALAVERVQLRDQVIQTRLAEQVDRLARMLVTAVSHDLRTPLASIKASSSVLADETLVIREPDARELAGLIDVQADRLTALVGNLLDMSRIQAGVLAPRYATVDLPLLVASVLDELTLLLRDYVVEVDIPGDLPAVIVDRQLIERVLGNLLTNAARHAPKGTAIGIAARSMGTDLVEVSVSDHGPGVVPEQRTDIFGLTPRRDDEPGAGLGLFISRTFVEAHGQRIWVGDAPSGGARFCFTLAAARVTEGGYQVVQRARH